MVTDVSLSRRQTVLIGELREVEEQIVALNKRRASIKSELERIYPEARELSKPVKPTGTVITIWNYAQQGYTCYITTTPEGQKIINDPNPTFFKNDAIAILALCSQGPANADKLLVLPQLLRLTRHPKRTIKILQSSHFLELHFTRKGV